MLESSLLQNIRKLVYQRDLNKYANDMGYNRELSTIIHAYLNPNVYVVFSNLFPQYTNIYTILDIIHDKIVNSVMEYSLQNQENKSTENPEEKNTNLSKSDKYMKEITKYIYEKINRQFTVHSKNTYVNHQISSFIKTKSFVHVFYNMVLFKYNLSSDNLDNGEDTSADLCRKLLTLRVD